MEHLDQLLKEFPLSAPVTVDLRERFIQGVFSKFALAIQHAGQQSHVEIPVTSHYCDPEFLYQHFPADERSNYTSAYTTGALILGIPATSQLDDFLHYFSHKQLTIAQELQRRNELQKALLVVTGVLRSTQLLDERTCPKEYAEGRTRFVSIQRIGKLDFDPARIKQFLQKMQDYGI